MSVLGAHSFHLPDLEAGGAEARKRKIVRRFYCATPALTAEEAQDTEERESDPGPAQTGLARGGTHLRLLRSVYMQHSIANRRQLATLFSWCWWPDSNGRPTDYESVALPTELHQLFPAPS